MADTSKTPFDIYDENPATTQYEHAKTRSPFSDDEDDSIVQSIETSSPDARRVSAFSTYTGVSSVPPSIAPGGVHPYSSPHKPRRPLAHGVTNSPQNLRALQMASPPPFATPGSGGSRQKYGTPRRRHGVVGDLVEHFDTGSMSGFDTPTSTRSHSMTTQQTGGSRRLDGGSQCGTPAKSNLPLVLLHVTVLQPSRSLYQQTLLEKVGAPKYIFENQELMMEKLNETVRQRGLLMPHPGEEYDLLEERLLESLELCAPRVLGCGHFYGGEFDDNVSELGMDNGLTVVREPGFVHTICDSRRTSGSDSGFDSNPDDDVCSDCLQPMHLPDKGVGSGTRRWDVKIYAANGLMRAGAWAAAWKEMERVDVEIDVWMPDQLRRQLDKARDAEEREEEARAKAEEEAIEMIHREREESLERRATQDVERMAFELENLDKAKSEADDGRRRAELRLMELDNDMRQLRTAFEESVRTAQKTPVDRDYKSDALSSRSSSSSRPSRRPRTQRRTTPQHDSTADIPVSTLLKNYIYLLAQDRRNVALLGLTVALLFLAFNSLAPQRHAYDAYHPAIAFADPGKIHRDYVSGEAAPVVALSMSTITSTVIVSETPTSAPAAALGSPKVAADPAASEATSSMQHPDATQQAAAPLDFGPAAASHQDESEQPVATAVEEGEPQESQTVAAAAPLATEATTESDVLAGLQQPDDDGGA